MLVRFCEFGRAITERNLQQSGKTIHYCGLVQNDFQANATAIRTMVYNDWDMDSAKSPPKNRPSSRSEEAKVPQLEIFAWSDNRPVFPANLLTRFAEGTSEFIKMKEFKSKFDAKYPTPCGSRAQQAGPARVGGDCDFTIDDGKLPLDFTRCIELPCLPVADFTQPRLGNLMLVWGMNF